MDYIDNYTGVKNILFGTAYSRKNLSLGIWKSSILLIIKIKLAAFEL